MAIKGTIFCYLTVKEIGKNLNRESYPSKKQKNHRHIAIPMVVDRITGLVIVPTFSLYRFDHYLRLF